MRFNISSAKDFLKCQALAHYAHDRKRTKIGTGSRALTTGTIWHKIMEFYLNNKDANPEARFEGCNDIMASEIALIDDALLRHDVGKDLAALMVGLEAWNVMPDWEVSGTELELEAPILGGHTLVGTLDALVKWNGMWWHVQHKTIAASQNLNLYWDYMTRDWHECGYQYMAKMHGYAPYAGTLLITARKLPLSRATQTPSAIINHTFLTRSDEMVDKAIRDLGEIATSWEAKQSVGSSAFIQNRDHCIGAFRNSPCQYLGVCNGLHSLDDSSIFADLHSRYDKQQ